MTFSSAAFPNPPAIQLANAIDAALARSPQHTRQEWTLQRWVGITDRTLREWRAGDRHTAKFNVADRVLCGLNLNWWEVWNEQTIRIPALTVRTYKPPFKVVQEPGEEWPRFLDGGLRAYSYGDLGPDHELMGKVAFAFTGEGMGEQLELVA
jgi:hypothetical protein